MTINFNEPTTKLKTQRALIFLATMATFVRKNNLERLRDIDTRFASDEAKSIVQQAWGDIQLALKKVNVGFAELSVGFNVVAANRINALVNDIASKLDLKVPAKEETAYSVKMSEDFMQKLDKTLPIQANRDIRAMLVSMDTQVGTDSTKICHLLEEIEVFTTLVQTLAYPTEFAGFEAFLAQKMAIKGWFINGEPKELLVHDLNDLRNKSLKIQGVYSRPDYCKTETVIKGGKPSASFTELVQMV